MHIDFFCAVQCTQSNRLLTGIMLWILISWGTQGRGGEGKHILPPPPPPPPPPGGGEENYHNCSCFCVDCVKVGNSLGINASEFTMPAIVDCGTFNLLKSSKRCDWQ